MLMVVVSVDVRVDGTVSVDVRADGSVSVDVSVSDIVLE